MKILPLGSIFSKYKLTLYRIGFQIPYNDVRFRAIICNFESFFIPLQAICLIDLYRKLLIITRKNPVARSTSNRWIFVLSDIQITAVVFLIESY